MGDFFFFSPMPIFASRLCDTLREMEKKWHSDVGGRNPAPGMYKAL